MICLTAYRHNEEARFGPIAFQLHSFNGMSTADDVTCFNKWHSSYQNYCDWRIALPRLQKMAVLKVLSFVAIFAVLFRGSEVGGFCTGNGDCSGLNMYCCDGECLPSCEDHSCFLNSDCGDDSNCCNSDTCQLSCVGHSCDFDSDCGGFNEFCCSDTCQEGSCSVPGWAIALIVSGVFIIFIIFGVTLYRCTIGRRTPGLIVTAPVIVPGSNVNYGAVYPQPDAPLPGYYHQPIHQRN